MRSANTKIQPSGTIKKSALPRERRSAALLPPLFRQGPPSPSPSLLLFGLDGTAFRASRAIEKPSPSPSRPLVKCIPLNYPLLGLRYKTGQCQLCGFRKPKLRWTDPTKVARQLATRAVYGVPIE